MNPDYSDPTDPRVIALLYANPSHRPDWQPEDRPPWPGAIGSIAFRDWCAARLLELDEMVSLEYREKMAAALDPSTTLRLATGLSEMLGSREMIRFGERVDLAVHDLTRDGKRPDIYAINNKLKRLAEPKRRGRTRGEESAANDAKQAAAWDIWKLRKIVLPRFWPGDAVGEFHLARLELGKVVAKFHDCTANEAERAFRDGRFAGK